MIWSLIVLSISLVSFSDGQKLHEHLTKEEIQSIFHCDHDAVHKMDYEVVKVYHQDHEAFNADSSPIIRVQAFNQDYTLYLEENNGILLGEKTPLFVADVDSSGIVYTEKKYPFPGNLRLFHDMETRAAVTIHKDSDNRVHVDGTVGDNLVIRPLPARVHEEILHNHPTVTKEQTDLFSTNSFGSNSFGGNSFGQIDPLQHTPHVVIRPNSGGLDPLNNDWIQNQLNILQQQQQLMHQKMMANLANSLPTMYPQPSFSATQRPYVNWQPQPMTPRSWLVTGSPWYSRPLVTDWPVNEFPTMRPIVQQMPPMVTQPPVTPTPMTNGDPMYIQLLITSDYKTYTTHGSSDEEISKYMAAFWNAVDLRYRELNNPKIRLNIAGLIVPRSSDAASYMEKHVTGEAIFAVSTLHEVGVYFSNEKRFSNVTFDIAIAISHRNLGLLDRQGKFEDKISGIANVRGACNIQGGRAAALVMDKGGFNGITTAAHEIAHTLGAPHDGEESRNVAGGPCSREDGYLMSYNRQGSNGVHWSHCSITAMRQFLKTSQADCLKTVPNVGNSHPKILPGRILTRDQQCQRTMGMNSYKPEESNCALLWCATPYKHETHFRPPAEGSYCGLGAICLNGMCVADPELKQ